jgi:hypothetical protein
MADTLKALEAERERLHGPAYSGIIVLVDSSKLCLRIKDSRSLERGANLTDVNQAKLVHRYTPGSWHDYTVAQSQATFT